MEPGRPHISSDSGFAQAHVPFRGVSSAGRAPALQAGGHRFDPDTLHHGIRFANAERRESRLPANDVRSPGNRLGAFDSRSIDILGA